MFRALAIGGIALWVIMQASGALEEDGCYRNGVMYPEGYEDCQNGTLERCSDGAWGDIGECALGDED
jgi:hypothetical protein